LLFISFFSISIRSFPFPGIVFVVVCACGTWLARPPLDGAESEEHVGEQGTSAAARAPGCAPGSHETVEYEEFFRGSVPCPSCRGLGRIPRELEAQYVAIIPLSDRRLKPNRTYAWVLGAVSMCVLVAGLMLFFLLPRTVYVDTDIPKVIPRHVIVNTTQKYVFMDVMIDYNVTNNNYFPVTLVSFESFVVFDSKVVGDATNITHVTIPMRSTRMYSMQLNITFAGDEGYIAYYCSGSSLAHTLLLPFNIVAKTSYMEHTEATSTAAYHHVQCNARGPQTVVRRRQTRLGPQANAPALTKTELIS